MILGFTGTRKGCTPAQNKMLRVLLEMERPDTLLHGGAVGADADAHYLAMKAGWRVEVYPAISGNGVNHAWPPGEFPWGVIHHPCMPLIRNRFIARRCNRLIACPYEDQEQQRGGTWMTVRVTRKLSKPVTLVLRDGSIREERS